MKILFICGSSEPGNDGVGDYTRRFCGELIRTGHEAQILSICDFHSISYKTENQEVETTNVVVHRIPVATSNSQRFIWAQNTIHNFKPDWISFQFVIYSFHHNGLPFWLPTFFKKLKGNYKWNIMFHELWLGIDIESSLKHKCIGKLQQIIIKKLIHKLNPDYITTQNQLYQFFLQSDQNEVEVLPICSNIPCTGVKKAVSEYTQFVLFGTIHYGAPFQDFVDDLIKNTNIFLKPIKIVFIGFNGSDLSNYISVLENKNIFYEVLGKQSEKVISQVLVDSDYGISTTPYLQTEKSGIYAAYKEHQLKTICFSRNWTPIDGHYTVPNIIKYEKNNLKLEANDVTVFDLCSITRQFINSISKR
jgi:hypothetical protein